MLSLNSMTNPTAALKDLTKAVAYRRVSTEEQGKNGSGLEAQRVQIEEFARAAGIQILETFIEVASGAGNPFDRDELRRALKTAQEHACPIIVASPCRLSRDTKGMEELLQQVTIIAADNGAANDASVRGRAARAEHDRALISLRTKEALALRKSLGVKLGNPNIATAQRRGVHVLKAGADERARSLSEALAKIPGSFQMTDAEKVDALNAAGVLTKTKKPWTISNFRRVSPRAKKLEQADSLAKYRNNDQWGMF